MALKYLDLSFNKLEKIDNKTHSALEDLLSLEYVSNCVVLGSNNTKQIGEM